MTIAAREIIEDGWRRLEAAGVAEPRIKMAWWVAEVLGVGREALPLAEVSGEAVLLIEAGIQRLLRHEPLQYVIGHAPFLNLSLRTDRRALIPRPETEELVMRVLASRPLWARPGVTLADVGTGSGCIALAIAAARPTARIIATDCSADALALARENAVANGLENRVHIVAGDLLEGMAPESLDAVVSNPPYIARPELAGLDPSVRDYEPPAALDGGEDGLVIIRKLVEQAFTALRNDGRLWMEIGDDQGDAVRDLLTRAGYREVSVAADLYGKTRFAEAQK
ncbi:MAG TPA: peptide chain release factor N(5)-glutamine methyltransferase [Kiritimatiellia bacterium]|nr:peptide chain release factor N(5)-glutamine methyltransferase [Kiritimatiellia bacterium]